MLINKPNIVILMADQLTAGALRTYGNNVSLTPNIDKLACEGVVFESAYCNSPLCAPSRAAMMTGQFLSNNGVFDNAAEFRADSPTFCHYLREQGYRTWLSGKMHFCGPDQLHGFDERLTTDIYPADFGWTPDWQHPERRLDWFHNMSSVLEAGECVRTNQLDFDDEALFMARQRLYDAARKPNEKPFLLLLSLTHPHDPFAIPRRYLDRFSEADIDLPQTRAQDVEDDAHSARLRAMYQLEEGLLTDDQIRRARHAYYGAMAYVDDCFGEVIRTLEETGLAEDTIVFVVADHGEMLGERGLWYKMTFFEGAVRIPFIVHNPKRFAAHRVAQSVSLVDLLPTVTELAGGRERLSQPVAPLDGHSLVPHLHGEPGPDEACGEYLAEGAIEPLVMIRRGPWKYIHSMTEAAQLYHLQNDPLERQNLAGLPDYHDTVQAFAAEVAARWDLGALNQQVRASQRKRLFLTHIAGRDAIPQWDFQPRQAASQRFIRNHQTLDEQEAFARYPRPNQHPLGES
ncbi:choline-sulfatase [Enterobacteriaceae bacterium H20N1]|uniref:Choline-sulfatase n=1 Tax=Dryocola boscaweniae TaxID=2925397 RepID=A0A9X3AP75_9ENTR|nr:choline-sulfatase [Dryocola boscaweniae]MCT4700655.1 choline-sulfatase [Dryocola boscaweniae]MCT4717741.1 choline-sulfatase [Dryocola boscaweniae]